MKTISTFSLGGLEAVPTLNWSNPNRILIHVCDAPCHGRDYYDKQIESFAASGMWDLYPDGDPKKRDVCKILLDIKRQKIQYFSIQLTEYTTKMFEEFQLIYGPIPQLEVRKSENLIKIVSTLASSTIMTTVNQTMSAYKTTEQRKNYTLYEIQPDWNTINTCPVVIIEFIEPKAMEDIFRPLFIGSGNGRMQIASHPFAEGSLRYAYYGTLTADGSDMLGVVYKEMISADPKYNTIEAYRQHLEIHAIAKYLAELFNQALRRIYRKPVEIFYADASIVQQKQDSTKIYQVEARFQQKFRKWNNNSGVVNLEDYSATLQAFSHWTFHETAGSMMIVDPQGVRASDENKYLLTDPAIHFEDLKRFREARTNLGGKGMKKFFRTHVCSELCEKLGLEKVENDIDENTARQFYKSTEMFTIVEDPGEIDDCVK